MDLKRLRTFVTVAEQGSVSKAALRLHLTQPALSRQIRDLQAELGIQLFDHVGRGLVLTSEGEQLLGECRNLLAHAKSFDERAQLLRLGDKGVLRVAASPVQIEAVLSTFLHRYGRRYPHVEMKLVEAVGPISRLCCNEGRFILGCCYRPTARMTATSRAIRSRPWNSWPHATRPFHFSAAGQSRSVA